MKIEATDSDRRALAKIQACGFISMETDRQPRLESEQTVTAFRFGRLLALGWIKPSGDQLLDEAPSQTWVPTQ